MAPRKFVLGLDLGTKLGVCRVFSDGGLDAQTYKLDATLGGRTLGVQRIFKRLTSPEYLGRCIEGPFSRQSSAVKAVFPMLGAAVFARELEGLPRTTAHLAIHTTGKGNVKEPDIQAAAKERWCVDPQEDLADAAWAGAFALDCSI